MYCDHFGFQEKPFEVTPDPKYLFLSPSHKEMLASLVYGIRERRGFIVIVGEVGTGKTTLLNAAMDRIDEGTKVAYVSNTAMDFEQILHQVLLELGAIESTQPLSRLQAIQRLNDLAIEQLARGGNLVLIVDEAQNLDSAAMENLRLLSNLETRKHKLIQIVLSGQPELDKKLALPELRQLAQRVSIRRSIRPLSEEETDGYLQNRLDLAGYRGPRLFEPKAQRLIYAYSGGIPRKINILCDNSLLIGYALKQKMILAAYVEESARDLNWVLPVQTLQRRSQEATLQPPPSPAAPKPAGRGKLFAAMLGGALMAAILFWGLSDRIGSPRKASEPAMPAMQMEAIPASPQVNARSSRDGTPSSAKTQDALPLAVAAEQMEDPPELDAGEPNLRIDQKSAPEPEKTVDPFQPLATITPPPDLEPEAAAADQQPDVASHQAGTSIKPADMPVSILKKITDVLKSAAASREVTVGPGDTLYNIIHRAYGTYDRHLLEAVMKKNPEISTPDSIVPGQVIRLPESL